MCFELQPTMSWICVSCSEIIENADHGWVEWISRLDHEGNRIVGRDIRIVHHLPFGPRPSEPGCQFQQPIEDLRDGGSIADLPLKNFQGVDGLMQLLGMIEDKDLPTSELLEIIKRIHIPGYEHARRHFRPALRKEVITNDVPFGFWWQRDLQRVLEFAEHADQDH